MTRPQHGNTLRVLQLTDPHLFADRDGALRERNTWQSLAAVIEHYEANDWDADLVYLTGDLVQDDSREAYRNLRALVDTIGLPVHVVPGNHDVPDLMRQELADYATCSTIDANGWRIVGVDTHEPGVASGRVGTTELERLGTLLAETDQPVAIFMHHPPVDLDSEWLDSVGLADREEFLELVRESGVVKLVVFGHVHQAFDNESPDVRIIGTPSTGRQFKPGSREFAVDDQPPAYRQLEFRADGSFTTQLVWIDT